MGFADLHIHSVHSHDGTSSVPAILKYVADFTDLNVIAITDHDKISGVREAVALGPRYGIEVIPGCEVTTAEGHLLALFITGAVPSGLPLIETVGIVSSMGGLCAAPHPEAPAIGSLSGASIRAALADPLAARALVGIEAFNSGLIFPGSNRTAAALARELGLASLGNSDAHILDTIGQGMTGFTGRTAADLRAALMAHETVVCAGQPMHSLGVIGRWAPRFFLRKMGWVAWNETPHSPTHYVRMDQALAPVTIE